MDEKTGEFMPLDPTVDPAPYLEQVDGLVVIGGCTCGQPGCKTVFLEGYRLGQARALVHTETDDGRVFIRLCRRRNWEAG